MDRSRAERWRGLSIGFKGAIAVNSLTITNTAAEMEQAQAVPTGVVMPDGSVAVLTLILSNLEG